MHRDTSEAQERLIQNVAKGSSWQFFFYRDNNNVEVDLILVRGAESIPIEIKLSRSPNEQMVTSLRSLGRILRSERSYLLSSRKEPLTMSEGIRSVYWYGFVRNGIGV